MDTIIFIVIFLLGTIVGSFLNVVIYRFNTSRSVVVGRSICMNCSHTLNWYEMIPVLSFLIQKGRCRSCATTISHQYPIVEFITGIIFAIIAYHFLPILSISVNTFVFLLSFFVFIFSILIVISVYDIRHKIIPDRLVYTFAFFALLSTFLNTTGFGPLFTLPTFSAISAGIVLPLPFALIWLLSKGRLMGLGDAKIIMGIGWLFGYSAGIAVIILSFWIGAVFALIMLIFSHLKITMKTEIPFAPFLILSMIIVLITNMTIFELSSLFSFL
jgi:leader peptidase (prepilin peptidase)/N-methyltransferase